MLLRLRPPQKLVPPCSLPRKMLLRLRPPQKLVPPCSQPRKMLLRLRPPQKLLLRNSLSGTLPDALVATENR